MQKDNIFNNYVDKCPKCGGELSPEDFICPYCGYDLKKDNEEYKEGEKQVVDALNRVNKAEKQLENAKRYAKQNTYKKSGYKTVLIIVILSIVTFALMVIAGIFATINQITNDNRAMDVANELHNQLVETIIMDNRKDVELEEYKKTTYKSIAGYVYESNQTTKIPLAGTHSSTQAVYSTNIYLDKFEYNDIEFYNTNYARIHSEDFSVRIDIEVGPYYQRPIDLITIYEDNIDKIERLDDIKIDDIIFECYLVDDEYHMISNPKPNMFLVYQFYSYSEDIRNLQLDEWMFIKHISVDVD
jgi:uncharacterized Zn finger protein (UPF0148 family)